MNIRRLSLRITLFFSAFLWMISQSAFAAGGGVFFVFNPADSVQTHAAGSQVRIVLAARDSSGNILVDWSTSGIAITLVLINSTANTDSSMQSWNNDPDGYSWARLYRDGMPLTPTSKNIWRIPPSAFTDGMAELMFVHTKAEQDVQFEISAMGTAPKQFSAHMNFVAAEVTNYLVAITLADPVGNAVYVLRPYELTVAPRDRWLNVSEEEILTQFSARWPGDFGGSGTGTPDVFAGAVFSKGSTTYLLTSRGERLPPGDLQQIIVYAREKPEVYGESNLYEVHAHAPNPFSLISPAHGETLWLLTPTHIENFTWSRPLPPDPYTNIRISAGDTTLHSDQVHYTWVIVDAASLTRAIRWPSNNNGSEPRITLTHGHLAQIMRDISGNDRSKIQVCVWYVEADDGLYTTRSTPLPGYQVTIEIRQVDYTEPEAPASTGFTLEQNFPNPVNPHTTIRFSLPQRDRVSLKVLNLLGEEVRTMYDQEAAPGTHELSFDASGLIPGVYVYTLETSTERRSRRMVVVK